MLKLIVTSTLLCTLLCIINAEEYPTITKEIKLDKPFSTTIINGTHLVAVASSRTRVIVKSTDEYAKICEIAIDGIEHPIQKKMKATLLKGKIIVWGVRSIYHIKRKTVMDYTVLIVDPKQCTYEPVKTYEEEFLRFDVNKNLPEVVTHDDSFDVFYSTMRACTPCRYSIDGKTVSLKRGIEAEPLELWVSSHVKSFSSPDVKNGFFYAHNYDNRTSVIKLYDQNFKVVNEKKFKHKIDVATISSGDRPTITTCHATSIKENPLNDDKVNCERFDAKLETVFSTNLPLLKKYYPSDVSVAVDDVSGDSFVTVEESNESELSEGVDVFRLYRLNSTGQILNTFKLREDKSPNLWSRLILALRGFIFNKQYCFETTRSWPIFMNPSDAHESETIKCIAI